jgi:hypothetical protein
MMKLVALFQFFCVLAIGMVFAQQGQINPVNPYPGGSPFPPAGEPSLTHTATAFWTTQDGLTTEIRIRAEGDRATQFACWKWDEGREKLIASSIAPECRYRILISPAETNAGENTLNIVADGYGTLEVRVHGFKREDFADPPVLIVVYLKQGIEVGRTAVAAHPIPEKFREAEEDR